MTEEVKQPAVEIPVAEATVPEVKPEFTDEEIADILLGKWQPQVLHKPFWGLSGGVPHEFVMRQGGIVSMTHKTNPEQYMGNVMNGLTPPQDDGVYAPTKDLIKQYKASKQ